MNSWFRFLMSRTGYMLKETVIKSATSPKQKKLEKEIGRLRIQDGMNKTLNWRWFIFFVVGLKVMTAIQEILGIPRRASDEAFQPTHFFQI